MKNKYKNFWEKQIDHLHTFLPIFSQFQDIFVFAKDMDGHLVYANQALVQHYGYKNLDEFLGKTDYDLLLPHIGEKIVEDDHVVMQSGKPMFNINELFPDAHGIPQWYLTHKVPLFDHQQKVCGVCGTVKRLENSEHQNPSPYITLAPAVVYIKNHFSENIKMEVLAQKVSLSLRQFNRRFKDFFNTTPHSFLTRTRIIEACKLLTYSNHSVSEIAIECGFYDHSHLNREFKKQLNCSPRDYRKQNRSHNKI